MLTNGFPGNDGLWKMSLRIQIWRPIGHPAVKSRGVGYNLPYLRLWRPKCDVFLPIKYYSQVGDAKNNRHCPLSPIYLFPKQTNTLTNKQTKKQESEQTNEMVFLPASQFPSPPNQKQHIPYLNGLWPGRFIGRETVEIRGPSANLMKRCFWDIPGSTQEKIKMDANVW